MVFTFFPMFFLNLFILHYMICIVCIVFLGLGHISLNVFFVRVCIVRVVISLMAKYHLDL